jgi:DNA-binding transcriptional regulator YhcF (GntR family)
LLRWSARDLAERAGVHLATIQRMEGCECMIRSTVQTLSKVQRALEAAGVEFLDDNGGTGVHLKNQPTGLPLTF